MACPVCFGGDDLVVRESLNAGIGVLLGVTALVLAAFLKFFIGLARRSREHAHLVAHTDEGYGTGDTGSGTRDPGLGIRDTGYDVRFASRPSERGTL